MSNTVRTRKKNFINLRDKKKVEVTSKSKGRTNSRKEEPKRLEKGSSVGRTRGGPQGVFSTGISLKDQRKQAKKDQVALESKVKIEVIKEASQPKAFVLRKGDKIVYPGHGVGVVEDIVIKSLGDEEVKFYVVKLENTGMKLFIPIEQAHSKAIRRIIKPEEVNRILSSIKNSRKRVKDLESWNRRVREYSEIVKNCEAHELADLISQFKSLNKVKNLSFGEKKILETAKQLLASELSLAKGTPVEQISQELDKIIGLS